MNPVHFLSLGPGDPELLTLKAVRTLRDADIVLLPATRTAEGQLVSRAQGIVSQWVAESRQRLYALPMSKDRQAAQTVYDTICRDAADGCQAGQRVVIVVEGDVSIYASIHYVLERLKSAGIPVAQSPGIPSFIAAAASAGLSLICQQERLVVLPGDADIEVLRRLLTGRHVVVVMKLSQCQQVLKDYLLQYPAAVCHYFENVGMENEFHTTDHDVIVARRMPYFSLCILYATQDCHTDRTPVHTGL